MPAPDNFSSVVKGVGLMEFANVELLPADPLSSASGFLFSSGLLLFFESDLIESSLIFLFLLQTFSKNL